MSRIRAWIRSGERFEGRSDGDGLVLTWRPERSAPSWKLRYRFAGKSRVMKLGSYTGKELVASRRCHATLHHAVADALDERAFPANSSPYELGHLVFSCAPSPDPAGRPTPEPDRWHHAGAHGLRAVLPEQGACCGHRLLPGPVFVPLAPQRDGTAWPHGSPPRDDFMCGPSALKWRAMAKRRIEQDLGSSLDRYAAAGLPRLVRPDLSSIGRTHVRTCCRIGRLDPTAPHARETSIEWRLSLNVHSSPAANRKLPPGR